MSGPDDHMHQMGKRSGGLSSHKKQLQSKRYPAGRPQEQGFGGSQHAQYQMKENMEHGDQAKQRGPQ